MDGFGRADDRRSNRSGVDTGRAGGNTLGARERHMNHKPIRILCVDDHAFLVEGLAARFALEKDLEMVGRLSTAENLADEVKRTRADVVLLDIEMPGPDAFEATADLRRQVEDVRVIILSAFI